MGLRSLTLSECECCVVNVWTEGHCEALLHEEGLIGLNMSLKINREIFVEAANVVKTFDTENRDSGVRCSGWRSFVKKLN